ncbi:MAG: radical SAM protein, partial [Nitrospinae bacterium]|nr:radical SAM protein [Nitrospinota bacterium]
MENKKGHPGGHPEAHPHAGEFPLGAPEGTIKEAYRQIKDDPNAKGQAHQYMMNKANQLRLVFWETTAGCNLECAHCRRIDVAKTLMKDDLTFEESCKMIDGLTEVGKPILVLSGGEPLYRPDIYDIARYAKSKGLTVALASNGTMINAEVAKKIVESGVQRVSISLDGIGEPHDKLRKLKGSYDMAIRGMKELQKVGMPVQINCTIAKHNIHQVKEIYQNAIDLGAVALHIFM